MGMGIPVIAPRSGVYPELLPECCLFERPEQALCLIERLMLDKEYWRDISENVKVRAERLRPAKVAESLCQAFKA